MALNDISAESVASALAEYRRIGERSFRNKYDVRGAKAYVVLDEHRDKYPAAAILRAAHRIQFPMQPPLSRREFSGGERGATILKKLGFTAGKFHDFTDSPPTDTSGSE
jgi:hypothetical protein